MIALITVPYDSGRRALRMGGGPLRLLEAGAIRRLEAARHSVRHVPIELSDQFWTEIGAARRLQQLIAVAVRDAVSRGERPIVLAGNCNSSVGTVAGVGAAEIGVIWLDAHPDLEMPETTPSGFFDGQALSTLTGRCWRQITSTVPHFSPVPPDRVLVVGGREASDAEHRALESFEWMREDMMSSDTPLDRLASRVRNVYLHIDLDVHGVESLRANEYASAGGPTPGQVRAFVERVAARFEIVAAALTAFDPMADLDGHAANAALELLDVLAAGRGIAYA
ncbi:MAG TPA: arginase family protein [Gemmatimonadaceae bacterium]